MCSDFHRIFKSNFHQPVYKYDTKVVSNTTHVNIAALTTKMLRHRMRQKLMLMVISVVNSTHAFDRQTLTRLLLLLTAVLGALHQFLAGCFVVAGDNCVK